MNKRRVVITGLGAVSAFGVGVDAFWTNTLDGNSAIGQIEVFDSSPYRSRQGVTVPDLVRTDPALRAAHGNPTEDATFYAAIAVDEALRDAGLPSDLSAVDPAVGCVVGSLCAGARYAEGLARSHLKGDSPAARSPENWPDVEPGLIDHQLHFLCARHGLRGPSTLVSTACSSGTDAIAYGADMIRLGHCDRVVVAGGDIISEVIHGGFNGVFSVTLDRPRPFDRDRNGFVIGEGGGALILEAQDVAEARGAHIRAEVLGYGLSNSAYHLTAPSKDGSGEALAIRRALDDAGLEPTDVDFINAHGTATLQNDRSEVLALTRVLGDHVPDVSITSIKSMIGHCMGAAGLMEGISTVLSLQNGVIPPTINFANPEDINRFDVVANVRRERPIRVALSNSFGFAGHNSCVALGRWDETTETARGRTHA